MFLNCPLYVSPHSSCCLRFLIIRVNLVLTKDCLSNLTVLGLQSLIRHEEWWNKEGIYYSAWLCWEAGRWSSWIPCSRVLMRAPGLCREGTKVGARGEHSGAGLVKLGSDRGCLGFGSVRSRSGSHCCSRLHLASQGCLPCCHFGGSTIMRWSDCRGHCSRNLEKSYAGVFSLKEGGEKLGKFRTNQPHITSFRTDTPLND